MSTIDKNRLGRYYGRIEVGTTTTDCISLTGTAAEQQWLSGVWSNTPDTGIYPSQEALGIYPSPEAKQKGEEDFKRKMEACGWRLHEGVGWIYEAQMRAPVAKKACDCGGKKTRSTHYSWCENPDDNG